MTHTSTFALIIDYTPTTLEELSSTDSDSECYKYWVEWYTCSEGNEYFCDVDEDYIMDRFNLTNLAQEVPSQYYNKALELITDRLPEKPMSDELRENVERSAKHLYGLIHARYIITARGLVKMLDKYKRGDFGRCPRVFCYQNPLLPVGITDLPNQKAVKLYCSRCEDIYNPKSRRHNMIDGAYFGTSFPHMLFQVYPSLKPAPTDQRYVPRIFGFKLHSTAELHRWQDEQREKQKERLGITNNN
ncbi:casein kinase 2 regulatory subunit [Kickxella alabastrina]|uniref:Casein kinase 2 regulatory subunit n=1 Tax=Kickxella alabastrina TaxID=61397 RepID=A0ACC1I5W3_9FUNG|nr:casein kinase 2 regulatory subunit [Kickxella alabastrina]